MRILMLFPSLYNGWNVLGKHFEASAINHGLASISAVLKQDGHEVGLLDMRGLIGWEQFEQTIKSLRFDVCLIGFHSVDMSFADQAIRIVKKIFPKIPVIAGGVHITYSEGLEKFSLADCIVQGEGELVTLDLIDQIAKGQSIPHKVVSKTIEDLDSLPFVDRKLFNQQHENNNPILPLLPKPFYTINFSRGCGFKCSYCLESKNLLWKGHRKRSALNCIEEILSLGEVGSLMLHDDNLPMGSFIHEFIELWDRVIKKRIPFWCQLRCDAIIKHKNIIPDLARIGMTWAGIGIEGSQRFLDFYNKHLTVDQIIQAAEILHDNQINIFGNYILASPTETQADIDELERMLKIIRPEFHSASTWTSYPGSLLYDFCAKYKLWLEPIEDKNNHYSLTRYPFERKIVGISYDKIFNEVIPRLTSYKSPLKIYDK